MQRFYFDTSVFGIPFDKEFDEATHQLNVYRIRGYNSINIRSNYQSLEIRSPKEILEYED